MSRKTIRKLDLNHMEGCLLVVAMLLAIMLEGACVNLFGVPNVPRFHSGEPPTLVFEWTACTPPQYWLLGALGVMLYRIVLMVLPPKRWGASEAQRNQSAFLRLWRWTVAAGAVQMTALYLDRISLGVR